MMILSLAAIFPWSRCCAARRLRKAKTTQW
jgi:hypothetical protein